MNLSRCEFYVALVVLGSAALAFALLTYKVRSRSRWLILSCGVLAGFCAGLFVVLLWFAPDAPAWKLLDARKLVTDDPSRDDLPVRLMFDQLTRDGVSPGGKPYQSLLEAKRAGQSLPEKWVGFYAPLLVRGTIPSKLSLSNDPLLGLENASLGAYLFVWTVDSADEVNVLQPIQIGYEQLYRKITINRELKTDERAAIMVFVYPWDQEAAEHLPDEFTPAIQID